MIEFFEKIREAINKSDKEIESLYVIILTVIANVSPGLLYTFFYKRKYFIEWDLTKLILISLVICISLYILSYILVDWQSRIETFMNTDSIAIAASEKLKKKYKNQTKDKVSEEELMKSIVDEYLNVFNNKNKGVLNRTSCRIILGYSFILALFYYSNLSEWFLKNQIEVIVYSEISFFVLPLLVSLIKLSIKARSVGKGR
jgi:hypothetical protein